MLPTPSRVQVLANRLHVSPQLAYHTLGTARRRGASVVPAAAAGAGGRDKDVDSLLAKYGNAGAAQSDNAGVAKSKPTPLGQALKPAPAQVVVTPSALLHISFGIGTLLAANLGVYMLAVYGGKGSAVANMVLGASGGPWWKYVSSCFIHASWLHLLRNLVTVWLSGSLLRKELSSAGIWLAYILCGVGANLTSMWYMPAKAKAAGALLGVASTGGAAGLAVIALLLGARLSLSYVVAGTLFWELLLAPILSNPVPGAAPAMARPGLPDILGLAFSPDHLSNKLSSVQSWVMGAVADPGQAWAWGAAVGALVIVLLARLPLPGDSQ